MRSEWRTWKAWDWRERALFVEAFCELPFTARALRRRGLTAFAGAPFGLRAMATATVERVRRSDIARAVEIGRIVEVAARHTVVRPNCLQRSVALWRILRRRGIHSQVRIGARAEPGAPPSFHAWTECGHLVVNDRPETVASFVAFSRPLGTSTGAPARWTE